MNIYIYIYIYIYYIYIYICVYIYIYIYDDSGRLTMLAVFSKRIKTQTS